MLVGAILFFQPVVLTANEMAGNKESQGNSSKSPLASTVDIKTITARKTDCFFTNTIHDWRRVDRHHIIVWAPRRQAYLLELFPSCDLLFASDTIAFKTRHSRFCGYAGDAVLVRDQRCSIGGIYPITANEAQWLKEMLKQHPKKKSEREESNLVE